MLFAITVHVLGAPQRQITITDDSLAAAVRTAMTKTRELFQPTVLRGALSHAEPFLPALAEAAGTGLAGQVGVQLAAAPSTTPNAGLTSPTMTRAAHLGSPSPRCHTPGAATTTATTSSCCRPPSACRRCLVDTAEAWKCR